MTYMEETLEHLVKAMTVSRRRRNAIARELRGHLDETMQDLAQAGWSLPDAEREAIRRLGEPSEISDAFGAVYQPSRRRRFGLAIGLAGVLLLGAYGGGSLASATSAHPHVQTTHAPAAARHVIRR